MKFVKKTSTPGQNFKTVSFNDQYDIAFSKDANALPLTEFMIG